MRRVARFILNVITLLSLLLCLASAGLWVRSYWKADGIERAVGWETPSAARPVVHWRQMQFISNRRGIIATAFWGYEPADVSLWSAPDGHVNWYWSNNEWGVSPKHTLRLGKPGPFVGWDHTVISGGGLPAASGYSFAIGAPHWLAACLFSVVPVIRLIRRRRRPGVGFCRVCSYDLTGNASGVCPECGTTIS